MYYIINYLVRKKLLKIKENESCLVQKHKDLKLYGAECTTVQLSEHVSAEASL